MRLSKYFLPTIKENPTNTKITSHNLMIRSGMIRQEASGIYTWLPIGVKVLNNIINIIHYHMNSIGCLEMLMPCMQPASLWIESDRFNKYGKELLKCKDRHNNTLIFGPTNEEMITNIFKHNIKSYKNLPISLYHIQWKFRDEIRPRFGLLRSREFLMKDAYTFDLEQKNAYQNYNIMYSTYIKIFYSIGITVIPVLANNWPIGGNLSHEFHVCSQNGDSTIFYDKQFLNIEDYSNINIKYLQSLYSVTKEKHTIHTYPTFQKNIIKSNSIEIGHIFYIGTQYSNIMKAMIHDHKGNLVPVEMGSYGIGISRLIPAIIEANNDTKGIVWPFKIAPFKISILNLNITNNQCNILSEQIYNALSKNNISVLYDDTTERAGNKFAIHDLIGCPYQIIINNQKSVNNGLIELKNRKNGVIEHLNIETIINKIIQKSNNIY